MSGHNPEELARFWDDLAGGDDLDSGALDPTLAETVQRLHTAKDVDGADPAFINRLMEELMHSPSIAPAGYGTAFPSISPNGRPRQASWGPSTSSPSITRNRPSRSYLQIAAAVLLVVTIGFGYVRFDPFGGDPDRSSSIPAAIVPAGTPKAPASPTASFIARDSHLIIGTWLLDVDPDRPGAILLPVTFSENGTLVMYEASTGVSIGSWHPTGERTAELIWTTQQVLDSQDLDDPATPPKGTTLDSRRMGVWRVTITIDESGKTMTSFGTYDAFRDGVSEYRETPWTMHWTRMIVDPTAVFPTPTP